MTVSVQQPRYVVRQSDDSKTWMVWDLLLQRPAVLKREELNKLAFSAAETLRDTLNADNQSDSSV
jgi:hypothetical protein